MLFGELRTTWSGVVTPSRTILKGGHGYDACYLASTLLGDLGRMAQPPPRSELRLELFRPPDLRLLGAMFDCAHSGIIGRQKCEMTLLHSNRHGQLDFGGRHPALHLDQNKAPPTTITATDGSAITGCCSVS